MPFEMSYDLNAFRNALGLGAPDEMPSDSKYPTIRIPFDCCTLRCFFHFQADYSNLSGSSSDYTMRVCLKSFAS